MSHNSRSGPAENVTKMTRVKSGDARDALQTILGEKAREAAGSNDLISKTEQKALDPFLGRAASSVRTDGGKGARVTTDALVARAASEAGQLWDKHNPPGNGTNSTYLSQKEVQAIAKEDPSLGALSKLAYLRVSQSAGGGDIADAVKSYFSTFDFGTDDETGQHKINYMIPGATKIDARPIFPQNRAGLPTGVLAAHDFYQRAEDNDWATVTLQKAKVAGHDVFIVFMSTDGDDEYLEILDKKGAPVTSARLSGGTFLGWDEVYGRARFGESMVNLDEPAQTEGLSEPAERAAAGQIPADWTGDVHLVQGQIHYNEFYRPTAIDLPGAVGKPEHEVALATLEYMWDSSLRGHVMGSNEATKPFLLGALREGTLDIGEFTRADGKTVTVANWKDIDDGSFTLYFDRAPDGRLKVETQQYNN